MAGLGSDGGKMGGCWRLILGREQPIVATPGVRLLEMAELGSYAELVSHYFMDMRTVVLLVYAVLAVVSICWSLGIE